MQSVITLLPSRLSLLAQELRLVWSDVTSDLAGFTPLEITISNGVYYQLGLSPYPEERAYYIIILIFVNTFVYPDGPDDTSGFPIYFYSRRGIILSVDTESPASCILPFEIA